MTIQDSGSISMTDVCTEFDVDKATPLNKLYRGGGIVTDSSANSKIPTSGSISLKDFYGASKQLSYYHVLALASRPGQFFYIEAISTTSYDDATAIANRLYNNSMKSIYNLNSIQFYATYNQTTTTSDPALQTSDILVGGAADDYYYNVIYPYIGNATICHMWKNTNSSGMIELYTDASENRAFTTLKSYIGQNSLIGGGFTRTQFNDSTESIIGVTPTYVNPA